MQQRMDPPQDVNAEPAPPAPEGVSEDDHLPADFASIAADTVAADISGDVTPDTTAAVIAAPDEQPSTSSSSAAMETDSTPVSVSLPVATVAMTTEAVTVVPAILTPAVTASESVTAGAAAEAEAVQVPIPEIVPAFPPPTTLTSNTATSTSDAVSSETVTSVGSTPVSSAVVSSIPSAQNSTASGCPAILEALNGREKPVAMDTTEPSIIKIEPASSILTDAGSVPVTDTSSSDVKPVVNGLPEVTDAPSEVHSPPPISPPTSSSSVPAAAAAVSVPVPPPPADDDDDDWYAACSDEEKYNPAKREVGTWEPDPKDMVDLLHKVGGGEPGQLQWRCPGRRSPTPERREETMDTKDATLEDADDGERVEETKFDFDEDFGETEKPVLAITPRRTPGGPSAKTAKSSQRRVASLDKIMNDIRRHKKIDKGDAGDDSKKSDKAALESTPRPLNKLKLSPKRLDASS